MCQSSLEGFKTRKAKEGETVYAITNHHGAFTSKPGQGLWMGYANNERRTPLICIAYGQKCTLENLQLSKDYNYARYRYLQGGRHIATLLGGGRHSSGDYFKFDDGTVVSSYEILSPIYVGVKPEHEKAMALVEGAITEAIKTEPTRTKVRAHLRRGKNGQFIKVGF